MASSVNRWQQVASSVNRWRLVAVRSHFGLRLDGRNKGWWASTGLGKTPRSRYRGGFAPPNPPPVLLIVSDILDSEIHDRTRVLYSYSYLGPTKLRRILLCINCSTQYASSPPAHRVRAARSAASVSISSPTLFFYFRPCDNLSAGSTSRTHYCASVVVA